MTRESAATLWDSIGPVTVSHAVVLVRCQLVMLDADSQPPWVEARFHDADGLLVRILDKEPIFADDGDLPGWGWVRGTELGRRSDGSGVRVLVSLDRPDSLETDAGSDRVEVWANCLSKSPRQ